MAEKKMLTASNSKLTKLDAVNILRNESAWELLNEEQRSALYEDLPKPAPGEAPHNINIHPLNTKYKAYIEAAIRQWQTDLADGKYSKKWREEAIQAGKDRIDGKFDEFKQQQREDDWGKPEDENDTPSSPQNAEDRGGNKTAPESMD